MLKLQCYLFSVIFKARRQTKIYLAQVTNAVILLQKVYKEYRIRVAAMLRDSATKIQSIFRGMRGRKRYFFFIFFCDLFVSGVLS